MHEILYIKASLNSLIDKVKQIYGSNYPRVLGFMFIIKKWALYIHMI